MSDAMRLIIEPWGTPPARKIAKVVEILHGGGVAAYPTDSVYALGCAIEAKDAIERIARAKQLKKSQRLALICPDLSSASQYGHFNQTAFRLAQRIFPGPYTLVVPASRDVPRTLTDAKRRTVGIRITSHPIASAIVAALGRPLLTTSAIDGSATTTSNLYGLGSTGVQVAVSIKSMRPPKPSPGPATPTIVG